MNLSSEYLLYQGYLVSNHDSPENETCTELIWINDKTYTENIFHNFDAAKVKHR